MELLALPPPPKKVKGWTLRQVTPLSTTVSLLSYPPSTGIGVEAAPIVANAATGGNQAPAAPAPSIPGTGALSGWPPLRVSYLLPVNTIVRDKSPAVAWWDAVCRFSNFEITVFLALSPLHSPSPSPCLPSPLYIFPFLVGLEATVHCLNFAVAALGAPLRCFLFQETKTWKTDGIMEVEYDAPTKTVTFKTNHVTALAVVQNRFIDYPFEFWEIKPCGHNEALLEIVTKSKKELQIKIGAGYCRLFRSRDGELRDLEEIKFTPLQLVQVRKEFK